MDGNNLLLLVALKGQYFCTRTLWFKQNLSSEWTLVFNNAEAMQHEIKVHL